MGVANRIADAWIGRQVETLRLASGLSNYGVERLERLEQQVLARLRKTDLTVFQSSRLQRALKEIHGIVAAAAKELGKSLASDAAHVADIAVETATRDLNSAVRADLATGNGVHVRAFQASQWITHDFTSRVDTFGSPLMGPYLKRLPEDYLNHYRRVLSEGVATGRTMRQILADVEGYPGFTGTRANLRTYVRSTVIEVHNHARRAFYEDNADLLNGTQWLSTLDSRTSNICKALDGLQWDSKYQPVGHSIRFPGSIAHPNCRSTQIPVLKALEDIVGNKALARKVAGMPASTRASMDGQVADDLTYGDWLKKKGDAFAREVLGPGRFELWKSGQLAIRDLVSQDARPLTLEELRSRADIAVPAPPAPAPKVAALPPDKAAEEWAQRILAEVDEAVPGLTETREFYTVNSLPVNFPLYGGQQINTAEALAEARAHALRMADAIARAPVNERELILYRGNGGLDPKWKVGDTVSHKSFMSTSWSQSVVSDFTEGSAGDGSVMFRIKARPGSLRALPGADHVYAQDELILGPGLKFRVLGIVEEDGVLVYDLEVVADSIDFATLPARINTAFDEAIASVAPKPKPTAWPAEWADDDLYAGRDEVLAWRASLDAHIEEMPERGEEGWMRQALRDYKPTAYQMINGFIRNPAGTPPAMEQLLRLTVSRLRILTSWMVPTTRPVRVFRGVNYTAEFPRPNYAPGDMFESTGFLSTSANPRVAVGFAYDEVGLHGGLTQGDPIDLLEVRAAPGAQVLPGNLNEEELIFPHGSRYRVLRTYLTREPLGPAGPTRDRWFRITVVEYRPRG